MKNAAFISFISIIFMASCSDDVTLKITNSHLMKQENSDSGFVVIEASIHNNGSNQLYLSTTSFKLETEKGSFLLPDDRETKRFHKNCNNLVELMPKYSTSCAIAFATDKVKPTLGHLVLESKTDDAVAVTSLSAFFPTYPTEATFDEIQAAQGHMSAPIAVRSQEISFPIMHELLSAIKNDTKLANLTPQQKRNTVKVLQDINFSVFDNIKSLFINAAKAGLKIDDLRNEELNINNCETIVKSFFVKSSELDASAGAQFEHSLIEAFEKETVVLQAFTWALIADIFKGVLLADRISSANCHKSEKREQLRRAIVDYKSACGTKSGCSPLNDWVPRG